MRLADLLPRDPIPALLGSESPALRYLTRRELLDESVGDISQLWTSDEAERILRKQRPDGSWRHPGKVKPYNNYELLETFRNLRHLVVKFGFTHVHPALSNAAQYLFSCQTEVGDLRGILGNQYIPYYHGAILELLVKAGYAGNPRVGRGLDWLLSMRQDDGGWIVPAQALPAASKTEALWRSRPIPPDRSKPFSHLATGMVLRAFAAHPSYQGHRAVQAAARLFKARFLQADRYNDRRGREYWIKFQYPYWWVDLSSGLETMARLGFTSADDDVQRAIEWFASNQEPDGLWPTGYSAGRRAEEARRWVGLGVSRALRMLPA